MISINFVHLIIIKPKIILPETMKKTFSSGFLFLLISTMALGQEANIPTIAKGSHRLQDDRLTHKELKFESEDSKINWISVTPSFFDFHKSSTLGADVIDRMVTLTPTPSYGNFFDPDKNAHTGFVKQTFIDSDNDIENENKNGDEKIHRNLSEGLIILAGGSVHSDGTDADGKQIGNPDQRAKLKKGMSFYDFGDQVGRVLVLNGRNSTVNDQLSSGYYDKTVEKFAELINYETGQKMDTTDYTILYCPVDWAEYEKFMKSHYQLDSNGNIQLPADPIYVRARIEFNVYANNLGEKNDNIGMFAMGDVTGVLDNYGTVIREDAKNTNYKVVMGDGFYYFDNRNMTYCWDATKWVVYEFNMKLDPSYPNSELIEGVPCMRVQIPANNLINRGTYFIRNIQFFVTDTNIGSESPSYIENVKFETNEYMLRPSSIVVDRQKIFVDEPTTLEALTLPTWSTRRVRWVLVDNQDNQYAALGEVPDEVSEIRDIIRSFDAATGAIEAKKSGTVRVQAISLAEEDGVSPVMSAITELPVFDVVWGIDILHEHLDDLYKEYENLSHEHIEISGTETAALEYQLVAKGRLENPRFDPETVLTFSVSGGSLSVNASDGMHHEKHFATIYDGRGSFTVTARGDAAKDNCSVTVKVADDRYENNHGNTQSNYATDFTGRDGTADIIAYGRPSGIRAAESSKTGVLTFYDENTRICISNNGTYVLDTFIKSQADDGEDYRAMQAWTLKEEIDNDLLKAYMTDDGKLAIESKDTYGVMNLYITASHAGTFKSSFLPQDADLRTASTENPWTETDKSNYLYMPYGPTWEKQFTASEKSLNAYAEDNDYTLRVEINPLGLSGVQYLENAGNDAGILYNPQGVRTDNPAPGIYIERKADGRAYKKVIH